MTIRPVLPRNIKRTMRLFKQDGTELKVIDVVSVCGKYAFTTLDVNGDFETWDYDEHDYAGDGSVQPLLRLYSRCPVKATSKRDKVYNKI